MGKERKPADSDVCGDNGGKGGLRVEGLAAKKGESNRVMANGETMGRERNFRGGAPGVGYVKWK